MGCCLYKWVSVTIGGPSHVLLQYALALAFVMLHSDVSLPYNPGVRECHYETCSSLCKL